jgi:hypothetical protein
LAKNTNTQFIKGASQALEGVLDLAVAFAHPIAGAGIMLNSAMGLTRTIEEFNVATLEPNKSNNGNPSGNLLTSMGKNMFNFKIRRVKQELLKKIDDFFTLYGYKVNTLKIPDIFTRPKYTYVQTVDCNIVGKRYPTDPAYYDGGIPNDDMNKLKSIFNNGATFWDKDTTIGDYSVVNSPT